MGERKIVGWVVALMPKEKGNPKMYGCDTRGDEVELVIYKRRRHVWREHRDAVLSLLAISGNMLVDDSELPRLRVLPVYSRPKRTAEQERADVVAWLANKFDAKVASEVAEGAHVGAAE